MIVAALTPEAATAQAQAWLAAQPAGTVHISDWTITEVSSALSLKLRTGALELPHRAAALAAFREMVDRSLEVLTPGPFHFRAAAVFVDRHDLGLRAADALHLALAADRGLRLVTLDARLRAAALALGVPAEAV